MADLSVTIGTQKGTEGALEKGVAPVPLAPLANLAPLAKTRPQGGRTCSDL